MSPVVSRIGEKIRLASGVAVSIYLLLPQPLRTTLPLTPSPDRSQFTPVATHHQEQDEAQAGVQLEAMVAG